MKIILSLCLIISTTWCYGAAAKNSTTYETWFQSNFQIYIQNLEITRQPPPFFRGPVDQILSVCPDKTPLKDDIRIISFFINHPPLLQKLIVDVSTKHLSIAKLKEVEIFIKIILKAKSISLIVQQLAHIYNKMPYMSQFYGDGDYNIFRYKNNLRSYHEFIFKIFKDTLEDQVGAHNVVQLLDSIEMLIKDQKTITNPLFFADIANILETILCIKRTRLLGTTSIYVYCCSPTDFIATQMIDLEDRSSTLTPQEIQQEHADLNKQAIKLKERCLERIAQLQEQLPELIDQEKIYIEAQPLISFFLARPSDWSLNYITTKLEPLKHKRIQKYFNKYPQQYNDLMCQIDQEYIGFNDPIYQRGQLAKRLADFRHSRDFFQSFQPKQNLISTELGQVQFWDTDLQPSAATRRAITKK